jgi:hypothetical protein
MTIWRVKWKTETILSGCCLKSTVPIFAHSASVMQPPLSDPLYTVHADDLLCLQLHSIGSQFFCTFKGFHITQPCPAVLRKYQNFEEGSVVLSKTWASSTIHCVISQKILIFRAVRTLRYHSDCGYYLTQREKFVYTATRHEQLCTRF